MQQAAPSGRLASLDGIRAVSFMIVFVSHLGFMGGRPGGFGVSVFFVVSGYLITTLLIREYQKYGKVSLARFYGRRTARIFPGMYVTLLLSAVLTWLGLVEGQIHLWPAVTEALYLGNYASWWGQIHKIDMILPGTTQFWSLCVEEHFYLLFPFAFYAMLKRNVPFRRMFLILAVVCSLDLAWRFFAMQFFPLGEVWCYKTTDSRMDSILWGCGLACIEQVPEWKAKLFDKKRLERIVIPICFLVLVATFLFHDTGRMTVRFTAQAVALLPIIYYAVHFSEVAVIRPLNSRILVHLGTLSYGLYLLHDLVILICTRYEHSGKIVLWVSSAVATWFAALLMHWAVEKPFEAVRQRLRPGHGKDRKQASESVAV